MLRRIAIIPDGTRRYARKMNIPLIDAYEIGFDKVEQILDWCLEQGDIHEATLWGLSTENINRPSLELDLLSELYKSHLKELLDHPKIHDNQVNVRVVGNKEFLQNGIGKIIDDVQESTKDYDHFKLNLALAYGGRDEILSAFRKFITEKDISKLNEETFSKYLYIPNSPDLIIRTSGVQRLSGYMLWQAAYSEIYFTPKLWPEFNKEEFFKAIEFFENTKRNFGE